MHIEPSNSDLRSHSPRETETIPTKRSYGKEYSTRAKNAKVIVRSPSDIVDNNDLRVNLEMDPIFTKTFHTEGVLALTPRTDAIKSPVIISPGTNETEINKLAATKDAIAKPLSINFEKSQFISKESWFISSFLKALIIFIFKDWSFIASLIVAAAGYTVGKALAICFGVILGIFFFVDHLRMYSKSTRESFKTSAHMTINSCSFLFVSYLWVYVANILRFEDFSRLQESEVKTYLNNYKFMMLWGTKSCLITAFLVLNFAQHESNMSEQKKIFGLALVANLIWNLVELVMFYKYSGVLLNEIRKTSKCGIQENDNSDGSSTIRREPPTTQSTKHETALQSQKSDHSGTYLKLFAHPKYSLRMKRTETIPSNVQTNLKIDLAVTDRIQATDRMDFQGPEEFRN